MRSTPPIFYYGRLPAVSSLFRSLVNRREGAPSSSSSLASWLLLTDRRSVHPRAARLRPSVFSLHHFPHIVSVCLLLHLYTPPSIPHFPCTTLLNPSLPFRIGLRLYLFYIHPSYHMHYVTQFLMNRCSFISASGSVSSASTSLSYGWFFPRAWCYQRC